MRVEALIRIKGAQAPSSEEVVQKSRFAVMQYATNLSLVKVVLEAAEEDAGLVYWAMLRADFLVGGRLIIEARGETVSSALSRGLKRLQVGLENEMRRRWFLVEPPQKSMP